MSFRDMVLADNIKVFSNIQEFADLRTIVFDGETYRDVPCTLTQLKAQDRPTTVSDHAQGIYLVTAKAYFPVEYLGGNVPEKGSRIRISDDTGFMRQYYVVQSACPMGMVHLELEGLDE